MQVYQWFRKFLEKSSKKSDGNGMESPAAIQKLARMLANTRDVEYSCDEVLELMDEFAEMVLQGEDAAALMPLVQHHLEMCGDCREEFEALLRILRASPS
jgi:hypothetical protein